MRNRFPLAAMILLVAAGAGAVLMADRLGWLGDAAPPGCPHQVDPCPFCQPELVESLGECREHGVPEALCVTCNPALVTAFQAEGDWCAGHGVPESQCTACNPGLLLAPAPAQGPPGMEALLVEALPRSQRPPDPRCRTQDLRVSLASPDIARQIGLETALVERRPVTEVLTCTAEVSYDGNRHARLSARVPSVTGEVKADLGDVVQAGQVLCVLDSVDLGEAKTELLRLLETVETARTKVTASEEHFRRMSRMEVRLAAVDALQARDQRELARRSLEREKELIATGATTEVAYLEARSHLLDAEARWNGARRKLSLFLDRPDALEDLTWENVDSLEGEGTTSPQELLNARIALRDAEAQCSAARQRLVLLGLGEEEIEQTIRERDTSSQLPLLAPFAGQVVSRSAVLGQVVSQADTLFEIADTSRMWAQLDLYEKDVARIRTGLPVRLVIPGLRGETFRGTTTWVSSHVDPRTRTLRVRAEMENASGLLRANMFGRARITVHEEEPLLLVPRSALQWEGCCNIVFLQISPILYEPRKVRLGFELPDHQVVLEGLQEGDRVVTTASYLLKTEILKGNIGAGCCGD